MGTIRNQAPASYMFATGSIQQESNMCTQHMNYKYKNIFCMLTCLTAFMTSLLLLLGCTLECKYLSGEYIIRVSVSEPHMCGLSGPSLRSNYQACCSYTSPYWL